MNSHFTAVIFDVLMYVCKKTRLQIQASIVRNSLQKWLADVVGWETVVAKPNGRNGFTVRSIVEEAVVSHVVINHRPESGVESCPLIVTEGRHKQWI